MLKSPVIIWNFLFGHTIECDQLFFSLLKVKRSLKFRAGRISVSGRSPKQFSDLGLIDGWMPKKNLPCVSTQFLTSQVFLLFPAGAFPLEDALPEVPTAAS